jgi:hypothetical protein
MSYDWGPHFLVPSEVLKSYSGKVLLRENFDEHLLNKELGELGCEGYQKQAVNPWYFRKKNTETWVKIGESSDIQNNFPVSWDTTNLANGEYEILGMMHVHIKTAEKERVIARQNIVTVIVEN